MPRISRMIIPEQKTVYHVMSRTALDGLPFGDIENDELLKIIKRLSTVYFTDILGFCLLGNHFHILVRMFPGQDFSDSDIKNRHVAYYGNDIGLSDKNIEFFRKKWSSLSEFVKDIKVTFSRYYNKKHDRRGTLWGERFKSLIVEDGTSLINCLAYIDLNPIRAGIVKRPEEYRWCSLAYHIQTKNKDDFLSMDFGLKEFGVMDAKKRLTRYRRFVYEAGAIRRSDGKSSVTIDKKVLEKERQSRFEITRLHRFRCRTRWFTDSGIIGTKEFVSTNYQRFKHHFNSKHEKKPKIIKGLDGVFSLKRLAEI